MARVQAARRWRHASRRCLATLSLSEATAEPLLLARRLGEPVHQTTLAQMAGLTGPSLSKLLDQLAHAGLIERFGNADDRRINSVRMTPKGLVVSNDAESRLARLREEALAQISDRDLEATARVLHASCDGQRKQRQTG